MKTTAKHQFLQRLRKKGFVDKLGKTYDGSMVCKVRNQDLFIIYFLYGFEFAHNLYKVDDLDPYISLEKFIEKVNCPKLKKELLFNLNILQ